MLLSLLRRSINAGILALSHRPRVDWVAVLDAGADLVLKQTAPSAHLLAAVRSLQRRYPYSGGAKAHPHDLAWTLYADSRSLITPDGISILLSPNEMIVMHLLAQAKSHRVERKELLVRLWAQQGTQMDSALTAIIYRLRRKIWETSRWQPPVHAVAQVGYEFRAPLEFG